MRFVRVDGKGFVHVSKYSMDREGYGDTMCGRYGWLVPLANVNLSRRCRACRTAVEK